MFFYIFYLPVPTTPNVLVHFLESRETLKKIILEYNEVKDQKNNLEKIEFKN